MKLTEERSEEFDKELKQLAVKQFELFCLIAGVDKEQAYACIERSKGKSYGRIAKVLGISKQAVMQRCKKCQS